MDTKKFLLIVGGVFVIFIIIVLVVVLGNKQTTPEESTLTIWNVGEDKTNFQTLISSFESANPSLTIKYVQKDEKDYLNEVLNDVAQGKGPDVIAMPNDWLPKYHTLLSPLPKGKLNGGNAKKSDIDIYKETFAPVASQDNVINNQVYAMPLSVDTLHLYLNNDLLSTALAEYKKTAEGEGDETISKIFNDGPKNWEEFEKVAQITSTKSGTDITRSGAALGTADNVRKASDILTLLMLQNGAKMTSTDNTSALFQTDQNNFSNDISFPATEALKFYASFADPKSPNYSWNESFASSVDAFANGKTAMMFDYSDQSSEIKRLNANLDFTVTDVPQIKSTKNPVNYASYLSYGVSRNSANPSLAWDFIIQMTGQENASEYLRETTKPSARLEKIEKTDQSFTAATWFKPDPEKANLAFLNMIKQVNAGTASQTAIEGAAAEISKLLGAINE